MVLTPEFFFPSDNSRSRSVSVIPWSTGVLLPRWSPDPIAWRFTSGVLTSAAFSLASTCGFAGAASDEASGAWAVQYTGSLLNYSPSAVATDYPLPTGKIFTGCVYLSAYTNPYVLSADGYVYAGSGVVQVVGSPMGIGYPTWMPVASGSTLFALTSGGIATMMLSTATTGTAGFLTPPLENGLCLAASSNASALAVGGYSHAALSQVYLNLAFSPINPILAALGGSSNNIDLYIGVGEAWSFIQTVSGAGNPTAAAWASNSTQLLVSDPVSGIVQVYRYSLGSLALQQTLDVAGATNIAVSPDGVTAAVVQPGGNQFTPLFSTGTGWVSGGSINLVSPNAVIFPTSSSAFVGYVSGISAYNVTPGVFTGDAVITLPYNPSSFAVGSGAVFAAGTAGTSGYFSAVSGLTPTFSFSWEGSGSSVIYEQGQVAVTDPTTPVIWVFGNIFSRYRYYSRSIPEKPLTQLSVSPTTLYSTGGTVFGLASDSTLLYQFTAPYNLDPVRSGMVGILTSGGWASAVLGSGHIPTTMTFDVSGNVWAATLQNDLYEIGLDGIVKSQQEIPQFIDQLQTAPLGVSSMTFLGSNLYAASSLAGPLIKIF